MATEVGTLQGAGGPPAGPTELHFGSLECLALLWLGCLAAGKGLKKIEVFVCLFIYLVFVFALRH